ncbi:Indole-3-pyruvate decarboxylase [Anaerococcus octavius]|jgi:pyruvate decarboxylase/indolepyruvate decarboxylase|uniref:Alpha-keto-acid decarboxylase n=1 Tax=Anaerococcus octavius TaxID=54007 RepID=A0A380WUR7_9FIRM|nr:thiamine pyrophosphate-binding protein [Anaerococcus octavius]SUU92706.1 Indole-3-pyruvate decarboxylase [Anaerococcus octavius]
MKITIGDYILKRLKELNINHIIGEPGDFNLEFLEQISEDDDIEFVGMSNELNAAFAADGYANENGISALMTTYSVGDLNALGGIAGSVAEHRPIIIISGTPPLFAMRERKMTHHTLADGDYENVRRAMNEFVDDSVLITHENARYEIDRLIERAVRYSKSVNIELPSNIAYLDIEIEDDLKPIEKKKTKSDEERLEAAAKKIAQRFESAKNPVVLIDEAVARYDVADEVLELIERAQVPFAALATAKAYYNESHPLYLGIYQGDESDDGVQEKVENSDFLISIEPVFMQANNGEFTSKLPEDSIIINADYTKIGEEIFEAVYVNDLVDLGLKNISQREKIESVSQTKEKEFNFDADKLIRQEDFYAQIARYFKENDVVYGETGTASHGLTEIKIPDGVKLVRSQIWGSIGAMLPMQMGGMLASPEKRHILLIGDGSFQVSAQALSRMIYNKQNPIIFLIDNDGYTIERFIMGMKRDYNDIPKWDYSLLPQAFSKGQSNMKTAEAKTQGELEEILKTLDDVDEGIIITVYMHQEDSPEVMVGYGKNKEDFNFGKRGPENPEPDFKA